MEFSLAAIVFLMLLLGIVDLGRAMYLYNGVSEAAREIARRTIVEPGTTLGTSASSVAAVQLQEGLVPGMAAPTFACVDVTGAASPDDPCQTGDFVRVTVTAPYSPSLLLGLGGPFTLSSSSSMEVP